MIIKIWSRFVNCTNFAEWVSLTEVLHLIWLGTFFAIYIYFFSGKSNKFQIREYRETEHNYARIIFNKYWTTIWGQRITELHIGLSRNENSILCLRKIGLIVIVFKLKFHITIELFWWIPIFNLRDLRFRGTWCCTLWFTSFSISGPKHLTAAQNILRVSSRNHGINRNF